MKNIYYVDDKNNLQVQNAELIIKLYKIENVCKTACNFNLDCNGTKCQNCKYHDGNLPLGAKQILDIIHDKDEAF